MPTRLIRSALSGVVLATCLLFPAETRAAPDLLGNDFAGVLYDINAATGAATNPRPTGVATMFGIALGPDGAVYSAHLPSAGNFTHLYRIDRATGAATNLGDLGIGRSLEGDLAFQPGTGALFAMLGLQNANQGFPGLYRINTTTAAATLVWNLNTVGEVDSSAMAFRPDGTLYILDTGRATAGDVERLLTVDPASGAVLTQLPLSLELGATAGAVFDPDTGRLLVADGNVNSANLLFSIDPLTGSFTNFGPTAPDGLAGLTSPYVPEPSSAGAFAALAAWLARRRRRP